MSAAGVVDDYLGMLLSTAAAPSPALPVSTTPGTPPPPAAPEVEPPAAIAAPAVAAPEPPPAAVEAPVPVPSPVLAPSTGSASAHPASAPPVVAPTARAVPAPIPAASPIRPGPAHGRAIAPAPRAVPSALRAPEQAPPQQRRAADRSARWLRLRCGAQAYAIELLRIREVVLPAPLLALRGAAPCVAGVMNLRGQVVPVVDLGLQLGDTAVEDTASTRIVVLEDGGDVLGLRVSSVEDVVLIGDAQIEGTHTSRLAPVGDHRIRGIARMGGAVMLLLDAGRLLALPLYTAR